MKHWKRASNYMGEDFSAYLVLLGRHRDPPILDNVNFDAALEELGGESKTVLVERASHWAVGWVETILIDPSNKDSVEVGEGIEERLANYPVLDEQELSRREWEAMTEYWDKLASMRERVELAKEASGNPFLARHSMSKLVDLYGCDNLYERVREIATE